MLDKGQINHLKEHGLGAPMIAPAKRKRSQEESEMQRALMRWWSMQCRAFGVPEWLLFSIPNGGARSAITGAIMKAEGARKGAPDLFLAVPSQNRNQGRSDVECHTEWLPDLHGLFLELKRRGGVLSPEQKTFHTLLQQQGYAVKVCWSLTEAITEITAYLNQK